METPSPSLPEAFVKRILQDESQGELLLDALETSPPVSVRWHPCKKGNVFMEGDVVPWCNMGRYLKERPSYTLDPSFHAGAYYPQEAGSMLIDFALRNLVLPENPMCLDLCAAPGGKSGVVLDFLKGKGLLVANEVVRSRALVLRENLIRWGYPNVLVSNNDVEDLNALSVQFDCILLDAPCSGEGMFRKDINARKEWTEAIARACSLRQRYIIENTIELLADGGYLLYSTCTFNPEENENNVAWMCDTFDLDYVPLPIANDWNLTVPSNGLGYACFPHKTKSEGFYIAVLRKKDPFEKRLFPRQKEKKNVNELLLPSSIQCLLDGAELCAVGHKGHCYAFPQKNVELGLYLLNRLKVIKWGIRLGEMLRMELQPDHELAVATISVEKVYPKIEVDKDTALLFLKGHPIVVTAPLGWCVVAYQGNALGWLKNIGQRTNNYFPKECRIRMSITR